MQFVGSHESDVSDVNVSLKTIAGNSVSTDPRHGYAVSSLMDTAYWSSEYIWKALGRNTHALDSVWEETRQDCNFTRSGFKDARIVPGDGVTIPSDAVRSYKRRRQELGDGVRT
ncbi:hypothetical protein Tco_1375418 [Tanacetum coccineum]